MWRYYNANPLNNTTADCTVRAISTAQSRTWDEVYIELSDLAQEEGVLFDNSAFIEKYLDERYPRECHHSKTLREFMKEFPIGIYVVTMKGHITCVKDGVLIDTFDCRDRYIWCAWLIEP